ncbi:hypothetical protein [uncultured Kordia sp.]|uniref:hypothetical protein n=1 Tax=uncultured Kordia sp. TaxID=507699 RepID=UPI00262B3714|nr:hypothetical protein [uncultured Kordia sp.]
MKELLALNKIFLRKSFLWISGIGSFLFSIYVCFFFAEISAKWMLIIYSLTLVIIPLFLISAWSLDWFRKRRFKRKILAQYPFSELASIGFVEKTLKTNHNSLVDHVVVAEINDLHIAFDVDLHTPKTATFTVYGSIYDMNSKEYIQKAKDYAYKNIDFTPGSFTRMIHTKKESVQSIQQLQKVLVEFTHIVKKERFQSLALIK